MIIQETGTKSWKILCIVLAVFNPFPRRIKIVKDGKYVLDIIGRRKSKRVEQQELARRREQKEDERQCFTISAKGLVEMSGKSE